MHPVGFFSTWMWLQQEESLDSSLHEETSHRPKIKDETQLLTLLFQGLARSCAEMENGSVFKIHTEYYKTKTLNVERFFKVI
jgi:hypothetical protein